MPKLTIDDCTFNAKGYAYFSARVVDHQIRPNNDGTNWSLTLMLEVTEGPATGKHAWADNWLSLKAWPNTQSKLKKCFAWEGELPALRYADFRGHDVTLSATLETRKDKPELKPELKFNIFPVGGGTEMKPVSDDQWNALLAQHGLAERIESPAEEMPF